MDNLIKLLAVLGLAVFAMVYLVERFGKPVDEEKLAKLSRWILPLLVVFFLLNLLAYYFT